MVRDNRHEVGLAVGAFDEIFVGNGFDRYQCAPGDIAVPAGALVLVRGWAADPQCRRPASELVASVDDRVIPARYGLQRDDVAMVHGQSALALTGFQIVIETKGLTDGVHALRIALDQSSPTDHRAFAPLLFRVDKRPSKVLRTSVGGTFEIEIERFHAINRPPSNDAQFERKQIAVLGGRLRERSTDKAPASLVGIIDGFTSAPGLVKLRTQHGDDGFLICFPNDRELGAHEISIVAQSEGGAIERVASLPFTVVPICCGPAEPILDDRIASAHIEWSGASASSGGSFSRDEVAFVRGWALDPIDGDSIGEAFLTFADGRAVELQTRQRRDDIVTGARPPGARNCGFVGSINIAAFDPGTHVGRVVVQSKDYKRRHATDASIAFIVR